MTDFRKAQHPDGRYIWNPGMTKAEAEAIIRELARAADEKQWTKRITG